MKKEKILNEITTFCNECGSKDYCSEEECVLYRIEKIVDDKMQTYKVEIKETLSKIITIKATSKEEAIDKVEDRYRKCEIVLGGDDCVAYDIDVLVSDENEE
jgi:hypothetical protein